MKIKQIAKHNLGPMHSVKVTRDEDGKRKVTTRYIKDSFLTIAVLIFESGDAQISGKEGWSV